MKFMMLVKANKDTEAGVMPDEKLIGEMTRYNEELAKAGVLLDLAGLQPELEGCTHQLLRRTAHGGRRPLHRD